MPLHAAQLSRRPRVSLMARKCGTSAAAPLATTTLAARNQETKSFSICMQARVRAERNPVCAGDAVSAPAHLKEKNGLHP